MLVKLHPISKIELEDPFLYYEKIEPGLGVRFLIVYFVYEDSIEILAIAHFSRKPNYWIKIV